MLLLLRKLKHNLFANEEFRKYLLYALGEMVLVIIGILIALQIDNWNTARKDRETLDSYLQSIARNISGDLAEAERIRARREEAFQSSARIWALIDFSGYNDVEVVTTAYAALLEARALHTLHTNNSGYDALKSSGNLDQLQGTDLEELLYDYYDTISRIRNAEANYNEFARQLWLNMLSDWPDGVEEWEVADARVLTLPRFEELQPAYSRLLGSTHAEALRVHAISIGPLLKEFERLRLLGTAFVHLVDQNSMRIDATAASSLDRIDDLGDDIGYPVVVENGRIAWHSYSIICGDSNMTSVSYTASEEAAADSGPDGLYLGSLEWRDESIRVDYPGGADWAGFWIFVGQASARRIGMDFSSFDTLVLELKGDNGGEIFSLTLEDRDDSGEDSTRIRVELTDQWQTYEFDLDDFETADLTRLRVVAGFAFLDGPASFSIRNIRYLKAD